MIEGRDGARCLRIANHVVSAYARDHVARALYDAALEGLDFGARDLPQPEDREWVRGAIAVPLQEATEAALEVFSWSIAKALANAPDGLLDRYERSHSSALMHDHQYWPV